MTSARCATHICPAVRRCSNNGGLGGVDNTWGYNYTLSTFINASYGMVFVCCSGAALTRGMAVSRLKRGARRG